MPTPARPSAPTEAAASTDRRLSDERVRGFHGAYVSNARFWSSTCRALLRDDRTPGELHLSLVALWKCLSYTDLLVVGRAPEGIPADAEALADIPLSVSNLQRHLARANGFRDEVLHLQKFMEAARGYSVHLQHTEPRVSFKSTMNPPSAGRARGRFVTDEITKPEIEAFLDQL